MSSVGMYNFGFKNPIIINELKNKLSKGNRILRIGLPLERYLIFNLKLMKDSKNGSC
jgi:hypothetical protein